MVTIRSSLFCVPLNHPHLFSSWLCAAFGTKSGTKVLLAIVSIFTVTLTDIVQTTALSTGYHPLHVDLSRLVLCCCPEQGENHPRTEFVPVPVNLLTQEMWRMWTLLKCYHHCCDAMWDLPSQLTSDAGLEWNQECCCSTWYLRLHWSYLNTFGSSTLQHTNKIAPTCCEKKANTGII